MVGVAACGLRAAHNGVDERSVGQGATYAARALASVRPSSTWSSSTRDQWQGGWYPTLDSAQTS